MSPKHSTDGDGGKPRLRRLSSRTQVARYFRILALSGLLFGIATIVFAALHPAVAGHMHPGLADAESVSDLNFVLTEALLLSWVPLADFGFGWRRWIDSEAGRRRFLSYGFALSRLVPIWVVVMLLFCTAGKILFILMIVSEGIMLKFSALAMLVRGLEAFEVWRATERKPEATPAQTQ